MAQTPTKTKPLIQRLAEFTDPSELDTGYLTHSMHPYAAKFIPQLPHAVITEHTNERNTVLDPFCGSGTTLLEASLGGRYSIGVDSNPIATLISRAKTTALDEAQLELATHVGEEVRLRFSVDGAPTAPEVMPRQDHWFASHVADELTLIRRHIADATDDDVRTLLQAVLSGVIVAVSRQDSETQYRAVENGIGPGGTVERFVSRLDRAVSDVRELSTHEAVWRNRPRVITKDARRITRSDIADDSIDLIVTSPPYPNSYDYYLYHKLRMFWLGYDFKDVQEREIGSRYEHSSRKEPLSTFEEKMEPAMAQLARVLKPAKLAYFFVGDSIIDGQHIDMSQVYKGLGEDAGLDFVAETEYSLDDVSRSFSGVRTSANSNGHKKMQRVLVFGGTSTRRRPEPDDRLIASPSASRPITPLHEAVDGSVIAISSDESGRHVHSIAQYPSKFLPDIPAWAIQQYSDEGDQVLDPFAGSATTAVESILLGRPTTSVDVSPYSALVARAKTTRASVPDIRSAADHLLEAAAHPQKLPSTRRLRFPRDEFWFPVQHLTEFARLKTFVEERIDPGLQDLFKCVLGSIVRDFSYQDPGQIKVKRDPQKVLMGTPRPAVLLRAQIPKAIERLEAFLSEATDVAHDVYCGSATDVARRDLAPESVDLIVTSPPYINAMNYPMAHRYELVLLELVNHEDLIEHQQDYFGTERVYAEDYSDLHQLEAPESVADILNPKLATIFEREPKRSYIAYRYFSEMLESLNELIGLVSPGGRFVVVAGSNRIRQVPIDTFGILTSMLEELGMQRELSFHYEIRKQAFKLRRHETAGLIPHDGVAVMVKP